MKRVIIPVTTDSGGAATAYGRIVGKVHSISYVKPGSNSYADGVDFTITDNSTGENIWTQSNVNASVTVYPRAPVHSRAGVGLLYAAAGEVVADKVAVVGQVKIVLAQGGNAKNGTFHFLVD